MISVGRSVGTEGSHVDPRSGARFSPHSLPLPFSTLSGAAAKNGRDLEDCEEGTMSGGKVGFSHRPIRKSREMAVQAYYGRSTEYLKISSVVNVIYEKNQVHSINVWSFPLIKI